MIRGVRCRDTSRQHGENVTHGDRMGAELRRMEVAARGAGSIIEAGTKTSEDWQESGDERTENVALTVYWLGTVARETETFNRPQLDVSAFVNLLKYKPHTVTEILPERETKKGGEKRGRSPSAQRDSSYESASDKQEDDLSPVRMPGKHHPSAELEATQGDETCFSTNGLYLGCTRTTCAAEAACPPPAASVAGGMEEERVWSMRVWVCGDVRAGPMRWGCTGVVMAGWL
ncbi:PREDICTED: uncharacterized protein LOC106817152 [Priapulus caudatus]|uniref:Uncharacterized protein LOC106817152 n=1 Tax=Priapulus caudatus TaxID=37621 RepID=A0ABM1EYL9_PRICU|nr:PREDICTED: uncharacterized protein LOC106817152 [Priapulus caudatus]